MLPPTDEQARLFQLLFGSAPTNVALALELLQSRPDRAYFVRALALLVRASIDSAVVVPAKAFLHQHLAEEWAAVRPELDLMSVVGNHGEAIADAFEPLLERYERHAAEYEYYLQQLPDTYCGWYYYVAVTAEDHAMLDVQHDYFRRLITLAPTQPYYYLRYSLALPQKPETLEKRIALLLQAHKHYQNRHRQPDAAIELASLYQYEVADLDKALEWAQIALKLDRQSDRTLLKMADLHVERGTLDEAEAYYQRCTTYEYAIALNNYASFLLTKRRDPAAALARIQRAIRADPLEGFYALTLAEIQWYGFHDRTQALGALKKVGDGEETRASVAALQANIAANNTNLPPDL